MYSYMYPCHPSVGPRESSWTLSETCSTTHNVSTHISQLTKPQAVSPIPPLASMPKYTEKQLQETIRHAQREPDVPTRRTAEMYGVPRTTLHQRVLGKHQDSRAAYWDEQLFSTGEGNAIAEYADIMADAGFPLSPIILWQIAQGIINEMEMPQHGQGGCIIGPRESSTKLRDKRNQRLQGAMPSSTIYTVGSHWVNRFLDCNPGSKKVYIRYQERARVAATNVPPEACQSCTTEEYSSVQYLEL